MKLDMNVKPNQRTLLYEVCVEYKEADDWSNFYSDRQFFYTPDFDSALSLAYCFERVYGVAKVYMSFPGCHDLPRKPAQ